MHWPTQDGCLVKVIVILLIQEVAYWMHSLLVAAVV